MIHAFQINDTNIVLDVNSGAVHVVDDNAYELLSKMNEKSTLTPFKELNMSAEYREAYDEMSKLSEAGMLFLPDYEINVSRNNTPIKALCLHVAHDCNLRCEYCFASTGEYHGKRELMTSETAKKAIDFVVSNSQKRRNIEIDFFGGEPLMNFGVVKETVKYAKESGAKNDKNFRFTITTNGMLLNDDNMQFINEHMHNVVLSLDGRPEVNDKMRKTVTGKGCYDIILPRILAAIKSRGDKSYYLRGTFTRHNLDFTNDVLHIAAQNIKCISVEPVIGDESTKYAIQKEDIPAISAEYERLAEECLKNDFDFFHFNIDLDGGPCAIKRIAGCGAGLEYLAISPSGDIYPCHQFVGNEEFNMGNICSGDYRREISQRFAEVSVETKDACKNCWAKFFCSGGCHANAHSFNKDLNIPYEISCELERKRVECSLYIATKKATS